VHFLDDDRGGDLDAARESGVQAGDDGLLDLGAAETLRGSGERGEVEQLPVAFALAQMHREDLPALGGIRQVHEEDLIEATLPRELRRKLADVVRRGDAEDTRVAVLHPS